MTRPGRDVASAAGERGQESAAAESPSPSSRLSASASDAVSPGRCARARPGRARRVAGGSRRSASACARGSTGVLASSDERVARLARERGLAKPADQAGRRTRGCVPRLPRGSRYAPPRRPRPAKQAPQRLPGTAASRRSASRAASSRVRRPGSPGSATIAANSGSAASIRPSPSRASTATTAERTEYSGKSARSWTRESGSTWRVAREVPGAPRCAPRASGSCSSASARGQTDRSPTSLSSDSARPPHVGLRVLEHARAPPGGGGRRLAAAGAQQVERVQDLLRVHRRTAAWPATRSSRGRRARWVARSASMRCCCRLSSSVAT